MNADDFDPLAVPTSKRIDALEIELDELRRAAQLARELLDLAADPYSDFWMRGRNLSYEIAAAVVAELDVALYPGVRRAH